MLDNIKQCNKCPLHHSRFKVVVGKGNENAKVMFIGEAPGRDEDVQGVPFVGKAGKELDNLLNMINLKREDVYITNVVKCRPPGNRTPTEEEIKECKPYLEEQILTIKPEIIVCLGKSAAKALLKLNKDMGSLTKQAWNYQGIKVLVVYHPAATFYRRALRNKLVQQFYELGTLLGTIDKTNLTPEKELASGVLEKYDATLITDTEEIIEVLNEAIRDPDVVAFDTETTGLDYKSNLIIGFSIAYRKDKKIKSYYIPIRHKDINIPQQADFAKIKFHLQALLSTKLIVLHNAKFDLHMLDNENMHINNIADTMLMAYAVKEDEINYGLKELSVKYLDPDADYEQHQLELMRKELKISNNCNAFSETNWSNIPIRIMYPYACQDAVLTLLLYYKLLPKINKITYEKEVALVPVIKDMENNGIYVDRKYFSELSANLMVKMINISEEMCDEIGQKVNLNSPQQISHVITEKLGFSPIAISKKTSQLVTDDNALIEYYDCKWTRNLRKYRAYDKMLNTYVVPILNKTDVEGILRTELLQHRTNNGRLASRNPNLQNTPKHRKRILDEDEAHLIRRGFINPGDEWQLLFYDYSQIELRFIAMYANVNKMIQAFKNNEDVHTMTARLMYSKEDVSSEERYFGKTGNFLSAYGGAVRPIANLLIKDQIQIPKEYPDLYSFAEWIYSRWHEVYPEVRQFLKFAETKALEKGWVKNIFGRVRHLPSNKAWMAAHFVCSSCAADVIKDAMIKIHTHLKEENCKTKLIMQIHDELIFLHHKSEPELIPLIKDLMERRDLKIPITVDCEISNTNWAEHKTVNL